MTIQANQGFGVSIFGATSAGGGGSTSPGGSSGQLQYNASGSFGGMAGTSWDDTNRSLTLTGATVTTSQPVLNLSQTWNAGAVTFTGLKFNATDTASTSSSRLLDLQVNSATVFYVNKGGTIVPTGGLLNVPYVNLVSAGQVNFNSDTLISRAAAATLQLGAADAAAPVAQTLQVQSVVAGTTNTAGTNFTINGSRGTGTGAGGSIIFQVAPAGTTGTAQNALATALTIDSTKTATFTGQLITPSGGVSTPNLVGGATTNSGVYLLVAQGGFTFAGNAVLDVSNTVNGLRVKSDIPIGWANGNANASAPDTALWRDAANTLALRNGTSAQKLRIYNTYTSSTSYEDYEIDWQTTANTALVGPTKGSGGGTQRVQRLQYLEDGGTGSTTPSLGTTCPAASATIKSWIKVVTSDGTTGYIPCWA